MYILLLRFLIYLFIKNSDCSVYNGYYLTKFVEN